MSKTKLLPQPVNTDLGWSETCFLAESLLRADVELVHERFSNVHNISIQMQNYSSGEFECVFQSRPEVSAYDVSSNTIIDNGQARVKLYGPIDENQSEEVKTTLQHNVDVLFSVRRQSIALHTLAHTPIIVYQSIEIDGNWALLYSNEKLEVFTGIPVSHFLGRLATSHLDSFVHPDDLNSLKTAYEFTQATIKESTLAYRLRDKYGVYRHMTERVKFQDVSGGNRAVSMLWETEIDNKQNDRILDIFKKLEDFTQDVSLQTGETFLNHFSNRIERLANVERVLLCSAVKHEWWGTWVICEQSVKEPNFHFFEPDDKKYREFSWNNKLKTADPFDRQLYGDYKYHSIIPIASETEKADAFIMLCTNNPISNMDYIIKLISLFEVRVLREIEQCESKIRLDEQNVRLNSQKHQLTQLITLLGQLDTVTDEAEFLYSCQHSFAQAFELSSLSWYYLDSNDWFHCPPLSKPIQHWADGAKLVGNASLIEQLDTCCHSDWLTSFIQHKRILWPIGRSHFGFLVLELVFRNSLPDEELLKFAKNALHLAMQGLNQREVLRRQAMHDSLTKLGNRSQLHAWMKAILPSQQQAALLLFDLNRFKEINDSFGHQFGDKLLREIGPRISQNLTGETYYLARLGGDEFALFYPDINSNQAIEKATMLHDALAKPYVVEDLTFQVHASVGVSFYPEQGKDGHELLRCADVAMYASKNTGRQVTSYSAALDVSTPHKIAVLSELDYALESGQVFVVYQPLMDTKTGKPGGFEALVRWTHPLFGALSPDEFIPISEMGDGIRKITEFVMRDALTNISQWNDITPDLHVAVNISPRVLLNHNFPVFVEELLKEYDVAGKSIVMEITESTLLVDPTRAIEIIHSLAKLGIEVEIDDFGTGYSSLSYLKQLPISALKIDRSFVRDILSDASDEVIVSSTINMAHNLGLKTVAEGVEDEVTLSRLIRMGCDTIQGYYYSKPMPVDQIMDWLDRNK